jgi:transcriptional regulator with XRE-family HTH domain
MQMLPTLLKEARKDMGWDQRSLGRTLHMSDKTISKLETDCSPNDGAAQELIALYEAYQVRFLEDFTKLITPNIDDRVFLTLDFRFDSDQDERVGTITRMMNVVGFAVVRRINQAKETASVYDSTEIHVPPINQQTLDAVLKQFLGEYGPTIHVLLRNKIPKILNAETLHALWDV